MLNSCKINVQVTAVASPRNQKDPTAVLRDESGGILLGECQDGGQGAGQNDVGLAAFRPLSNLNPIDQRPNAVVPDMTVRLVGSKAGRPTANWNLEVQPTNLMAFAWLQIASELTVGRGMKKCEAQDCLEWFPERSNKRFCSNRCKMVFIG